MRIRLNSFNGMFPKIHPTRLTENASSNMQDMLLENGVLTPITQPAVIMPSVTSDIKQVWCHDITTLQQYPWRLFDKFVSVARSPNYEAEKKRYYWSNDEGEGGLTQTTLPYQVTTTTIVPSADPNSTASSTSTTVTDYPAKDYKVGVPAPLYKPSGKCFVISKWTGTLNVADSNVSAISVNTTQTGGEIISKYQADGSTPDEARAYVFTYVNIFNEESAPSPPSDIIFCPMTGAGIFSLSVASQLDSSVPMVELFLQQAEASSIQNQGYAPIKSIRIYRTNVASNGNAEFQFVREIDVNYTDTIKTDTGAIPANSILCYDMLTSDLLSELLPTQNWLPPSQYLKGLGIGNNGFAYAYNHAYNRVCFSEPYAFYAWKPSNELSSRYPIVAISHYDNVIVIATSGELMLAIGDSPEALTVVSPALGSGCVAARSMVSTGVSCIYASNDGLMIVSGQSVQNLTEHIFDRKGWQALNPKSIHGYFYQGNYIFFYDNGVEKAGFVIDLSNIAKGVMQISQWCISGFVDKQTNELYLLTDIVDGGLKLLKFNPDYGVKGQASWQSKPFNLDTPKRMLAGQVLADTYIDVVMTVMGDGKVIGEYRPKDAKPFRIHNHSVKRDFQLVVKGSDVVREIAIGETMRDMLS